MEKEEKEYKKPQKQKHVSRPLTPFARARRERRGKPILGLNTKKITVLSLSLRSLAKRARDIRF